MTESTQSSPANGSELGMAISRSSPSIASRPALSFFCIATSISFSSPVNNVTCLVAVMIEGVSLGLTGSCAAPKTVNMIKTDSKRCPKWTGMFDSPLVVHSILMKEKPSGVPDGF